MRTLFNYYRKILLKEEYKVQLLSAYTHYKMREWLWRNQVYKPRKKAVAQVVLHPIGIEMKATLLINPNDTGISRTVYIYGIKEPLNTLVTYKTVEKNKPSVLDIGSNIGYFPLIEALAGATEIYAIEPVSSTFRYLQYNMMNHISKSSNNLNFLLGKFAVSNEPGFVNIYT